jgi:hypothetical protein
MKRIFNKIRVPRAGVVLGVIALVAALGGTAIAAKTLRINQFDDSSRNRLAGTGVIQYAATAQTTGNADVPATPPATSPAPKVQTFSVTCELSKKATSGGYKWTGGTPPLPTDYKLLDAYPNGGGFVVRMYILGPTAANQPITIYSNCVKSRTQRGSPPA